jgi:antitoxin HicB
VYPYETAAEGDSIIVSFPDVPGALTQIDPDEDFEALVYDCLVAALGGYIVLRKPIPRPSAALGRPLVSLDVLVSAKLALASALAEANMTNVRLAQELGVSEKVIRRLLDLDHVSRIDRLEDVLAFFNRRLEVSVHSRPCNAPDFVHSA